MVPTLSAVKKYGKHVRDPDLAQDRRVRRRIGAHQLERRRLDLGQPAGHVDHDREEHEQRDDHHLGQRVEHPEPVVHDRREGDDRDGARPDRERQEQLARGHEAGRQSATTTPAIVPMTSPPRASKRVASRRRRSGQRRSPSCRRAPSRSAIGGGSGKPRIVDVPDDELPEHDRSRRRRGSPAGRGEPPQPAGARASRPGGLGRDRPAALTRCRLRPRPGRATPGVVGLPAGSSPSAPPRRSASRTAVTSSK